MSLETQKISRREQMLIFCCLLFMGSLIVADFSSSKVISLPFLGGVFGTDFLIPVGTIAFALTYLATDVISELYSRRHAITVIWCAVLVRLGVMLYVLWGVGVGSKGNVWPNDLFGVAPFWTSEMQTHYAFVFNQAILILIAGFAAILIASLLDVYIFHYFKERDKEKKFWLRNNLSTIFGQIVNSTIFITIAFGSIFTPTQILLAIMGQVIIKVLVALVDTPFAYIMRNYGQGKEKWYVPWK